MLYLYNLRIFKHFKTMTSISKEQNITLICNSAFQILPVIIIIIDPYLSSLNNQNLLSKFNRARNNIVNVRRNYIVLGSIHVTNLLWGLVISKKPYARFVIILSDNQSEEMISITYSFKSSH